MSGFFIKKVLFSTVDWSSTSKTEKKPVTATNRLIKWIPIFIGNVRNFKSQFYVIFSFISNFEPMHPKLGHFVEFRYIILYDSYIDNFHTSIIFMYRLEKF